MALIPIRVDRVSKPPLGTPLRSDGHWSVQGLVGAWAFNEGAGGLIDAVTQGTSPMLGTPVCNAEGVEFVTGSGCKVRDNFRTPVFTIVFEGSNPVQGYASKRVIANYNIAAGLIFLCNFVDSTGDIYFRVVNTAYTDFTAIATNAASVTSKSIKGFVKIDGSNIVSGNGNITATTAFTGTLQTFTTIPLSIGCSLNNGAVDSSAAGFTHKWLYFYDVALTPQQTTSLSENPWQIYEPETIWINVGGGGAGLAYPSGVGSTASIGTATGKGKATKAATGSGSTASVGTVTAKGKASNTVSGISCTCNVGTSTAKGKATKVITGVGATSSIGSVSATHGGGIHYATPNGVSVTSYIGTAISLGKGKILVNGQGVVTSIGNVVASHASGAAFAYPSGVSTTAYVGSVYASGKIVVVSTYIKVTRDQLSSFIDDPRTIKAFEQLIKIVNRLNTP